MCKKSKEIVLYLNILASMAWVIRRITHHIIFFACALFKCAIHTTSTSIYNQPIALSGLNHCLNWGRGAGGRSVPLYFIKLGTLKTSPPWGCLLLNGVFGFCFHLFLFSITSCKVMVIFSQKTVIVNDNHGLR
jgi:hypothetical protein